MHPLRRIFALVPDCHAGATRYASLWRRHFYEGLAGAVPDVIFPTNVDFSWARPAQNAPAGPTAERASVSERLWEQIRAARADAVISYCFAADVELGLVKRTIDSGVPWVNFFCDSVVAFDWVEPLARTVSLNWFPEGQAEQRYRALGRPRLCRPYAVNPSALPESICNTALHLVGFVGAPFTNRVIALAALRFYGCKVSVRGEGWLPSPASQSSARPIPRGRRASLPSRHAHGKLGDRVLARVLRPLVQAGGPLEHAELSGFVSSCRLVLGLNAGRDSHGALERKITEIDGQFRISHTADVHLLRSCRGSEIPS